LLNKTELVRKESSKSKIAAKKTDVEEERNLIEVGSDSNFYDPDIIGERPEIKAENNLTGPRKHKN